MNFQTMSKQRKMILIAAAVGIISMFLPWVSVFGFSANGMNGWGILVFLCFLGAAGLSVMGDQTKNLDTTFWMITLVAGGLAFLIMLVNLIDASGNLGYLEVGFWGALLASAAIVCFAYMYRTQGDTLQGGFDSLKNQMGNTAKPTETTVNPTTKVINPANDPSKPVV